MFIRKTHNKALKGTKLQVTLTVLVYNRVSRLEGESELRQKYLYIRNIDKIFIFPSERVSLDKKYLGC